MNTAHASASTGGSKYGASHSAKTMNETLSSAGVNAGTENRLYVFSTPPASAVSEMNRMYGKRDAQQIDGELELLGTVAQNPGAIR